MRLKQRSRVDLPQPDGPMNAVMRFFGMSMVDVADGPEVAVVGVEVRDLEDDARLGAGVVALADAAPSRRACPPLAPAPASTPSVVAGVGRRRVGSRRCHRGHHFRAYRFLRMMAKALTRG